MTLRTWHLRTGSVVLTWLVALVVVAGAHDVVAQSHWLLIHLLGLGAASNAILIWSWYFTEAVLRLSHKENRRSQSARLVLFNTGALAVIAGYGSHGPGGSTWLPILVGGTLAFGAIAWHAVALAHRLKVALPSRFGPIVHYYVAAGACLLVGIGFGVTMARGDLPGDWQSRLAVAHAGLNLLGWIGLTVLGTLVTLWPTILRTRMAPGVEQAAKRSLPLLICSVAVIVAGALAGQLLVAAAGIGGYTVTVGYVAWSHADEVRRKRPTDVASLSVLAGIVWLFGTLVALTVALATAGDWFTAQDRLSTATTALFGGFLTQVLLGALSYLIPVVLGSSPTATQAAMRTLDTAGAARVTAANAGLLVWALPGSGVAHTLCAAVAAAALASFVPLAVRAAVLARREAQSPPGPRSRLPHPETGVLLGLGAAGLAVVVLAAAVGVAADPGSVGLPGRGHTAETVTATGQTTQVQVRVEGMRFVPNRIEVPLGNRLVLTLDNTGTQTHDLVLPDGSGTGRLSPGQQATLDAGVVDAGVQGWCSVAGHRQMGMVFDVVVVVAGTGAAQHTGHTSESTSTPAIDLMATPGPGFVARDPRLPPAPEESTHRVRLEVRDVRREVAPGVTTTLWPYGVVAADGSYDGSAPGPTLRGRVGDTFEVTLVNGATIGHSVDFHAGALAPDRPMRTIEPGQELVYRFTATRSGIWLYHCSTMPMSLHLANGMFGAVVIDPPNLPPVDREYVLTQSEMYLGGADGADPAKVADERPDLVVFNGYANQYDHTPLTATVGERVRIWVLSAGPNRSSFFHVVGGQFDTVWKEGEYRLQPGNPSAGGSQTLDLGPAQGGFVELTFPEAGNYPFVTHAMSDAERGAHGLIAVEQER